MATKKQIPAKAVKAVVKPPVKKGKAAKPIIKKAGVAVKPAPAKKSGPNKQPVIASAKKISRWQQKLLL